MDMQNSFDIVIVNWNSGEQLRACLRSIEQFEKGTVSTVVVVDNASTDDSLESIEAINIPLQVIRNTENKGFGAACNQGAALCYSRYLLFLNPDTELFENSLSIPLAFMENSKNQNVGVCGIQLVDENGNVARTCAHFPSLWRFAAQAIGLNKLPGMKGTGIHMTEWDHLSDKLVDQVIGAFFFIRSHMFEKLCGFDERFFVYFEEVDFSFRARQAGWKTVYLAQAQAFHKGGGTSEQVKATRLFYSLRSRLLYGFKHFPAWKAWSLVALTLIIEPCTRTVFSLLRGSISDILNTWRGYRMLYGDFSNILQLTNEHKWQ